MGDEPDPICGLEVSKDRQVIFVNGSISLFCFVIAVDVYFESVKNMRFFLYSFFSFFIFFFFFLKEVIYLSF